jgi:hypothetical protein
MKNFFELPEAEDLNDLIKYINRALKMDPEGGVRLRAYGDVLTVYVAPTYSLKLAESAPLILGLRTMALKQPNEFDIAYPITEFAALLQPDTAGETEKNFSLLSRLAKVTGQTGSTAGVSLPESDYTVHWSNETPTRTGWELGGYFSQEELTAAATKGVAAVAETLPASVGGPLAARIRAEIWSRSIDYKFPIPAGAAFVAAGLGFLLEGEQVPWYVSGDWLRLSPSHGHVLSKFATDYVSTAS